MRRVAVIVERDDDKVLRAVAGGDHRHVEELIEEGADFNVQTPNGHTVLHVAAARGRANVLRVLLVVPAIVDIKDTQDDEGRTALWIAAANGELVRLALFLSLIYHLSISLSEFSLFLDYIRSHFDCCSTVVRVPQSLPIAARRRSTWLSPAPGVAWPNRC